MTAVLESTASDTPVSTNALAVSLQHMCWQTGDMRLEILTEKIGDEIRRVGGRYVRYDGAVLTHKNVDEIVDRLRLLSDRVANKTVRLSGLGRTARAVRIAELFSGVLTDQMAQRLAETLRPEVTEVTVLRTRTDRHFSLFVDFC